MLGRWLVAVGVLCAWCALAQGATIYVHVMRWTGDAVLLPPISKKIVSSAVLTGGTATVGQDDRGVRIAVPPEHRTAPDTIVVLNLDGPASEIPPAAIPSDSTPSVEK